MSYQGMSENRKLIWNASVYQVTLKKIYLTKQEKNVALLIKNY